MKELLIAPIALALGFVTAIPIGATQIEIAKRSLRRRFKAALMVVAGSVSSDLLYGVLALYGLAPFLQNKTVLACFEAFGAVLLWLLAFVTLRESRQPKILAFNNSALAGKRLSFVTGFSLAATNPMMVFWWLIGMHFLLDLGLVNHSTKIVALTFLIFGGIGIASYLALLAGMLYRVNRFLTEKAMRRVYIIFGIGLFIFSGYFLVRFIQTVA
jgi:threonine/homoserine/homoserine lactone efflux protein